jgi:radical SAM superfamily enzyme YgiQ (UPF0313 family)
MKVAIVAAEFEENLALRYLWGALIHAGHEVVHVPFNRHQDLEMAALALAHSQATLAAVSMVFTARAREFSALIARVRALGYRGYLVAGGHFATLNAEALLRQAPGLDAVGMGEGEGLLCDLAANLGSPWKVEGLVWRGPDGIRFNAPRASQCDLDQLPPPVHRHPFGAFLGIPIATIIGSRGCLHACRFCSISAWHRHCGGPRLRLRSPASIAEEMASLYSQGVRIFNFHDDNFLLPDRNESLARFRSLRQELHARGLKEIAFAIKARADEVDLELLKFLKEMGLFRVFLGIEAGSQESLGQLGRRQSIEDNIRALAVMATLGIHTCFNLLVLNPDSTLEDFRAQAHFLADHPGFPMNMCRTEVYAGTPMEAQLKAQGRLLGDIWGLDYVIQEPGAERVFEIFRTVLEARCQGMDCLMHLAMAMDFELHLLEQFHGQHPHEKRQIKDFIVRLNTDTARRMLQMAELAQLENADWKSDGEGLAKEIAAADQRLRREAVLLIQQLRGCAARKTLPKAAFRASIPWLAAASMLVIQPMEAQTPDIRPEPKPVSQSSEKQRFRTAVGERVASATPLVESFLMGNRPILFLQMDLDCDGAVIATRIVSALSPTSVPDKDADLQSTLLPNFSDLRCSELAGARIIVALHRQEFQGEGSAPTVALNSIPPAGTVVQVTALLSDGQSGICEVVAASSRGSWDPWRKR